MMSFLNNMSVKARLYLAISLFLLTLLSALAQAYFAIGANISFAEKEKMGNAIQRPVALMLRDTALLRADLAMLENAHIQDYIKDISAQMEALKAAEAKYGEALEFTDEGLGSRDRSQLKFETVMAKWTKIAQGLTQNPAGKDNADLLVSFIADLRGITAHSGDTSNLILDPDLDSYYLMDVTLLAMPQTIDRLGEIAQDFYPELGQTVSENSKNVTVNAAVMSRMLSESDMGRVSADMDTSFHEDANFYGVSPKFQEEYMPLLDQYTGASTAVIEALNDISAGKAVDLAQFSKKIDDAINASGTFISEGFNQLDTLLDMRIKSYKGQQIKMLLISLGGLIISMGFYALVSSSIGKPLENLNQVMLALSNQDYSVSVPYSDARSEIGQMAGAVEIFKKNGLEAVKMKEEQERLEKQNAEDKKRMMLELANQFDEKIGAMTLSLSGAAEQMQTSAKGMESTARTTQSASTSVAAASEETSANIATVASATEEMSASAKEISKQVSDVAAKASQASGSAKTTSEKVNELNELVGNIGEVVTAIKDIAEQTNLLALNATIEAARAGDVGKGFAVVADEVKKLATETAKKTEEIEERIGHVQSATQDSVSAMAVIINNISDIDALSAGAASAVEQQNATLAEITRNISEVSAAARDVANIINQVQQGATDTGESSESLKHASDNIVSLSADLENAVKSFLGQIRSGNA